MPNATPRASYIDVNALRALVRKYRRTKRVSDELGKCLLAIAGGVWERYRFLPDKDDFVGEAVLHLIQRPLAKADVQKHVFNYFTTCAIRYGMNLREKAATESRRFQTYAAELVEAGHRELPRYGRRWRARTNAIEWRGD